MAAPKSGEDSEVPPIELQLFFQRSAAPVPGFASNATSGRFRPLAIMFCTPFSNFGSGKTVDTPPPLPLQPVSFVQLPLLSTNSDVPPMAPKCGASAGACTPSPEH